MHVYHVLIIGCVFYTLCLVSACSCIGHASHMYNRCTFATHTLTLDMFCIDSYQLSLLVLLAHITCSCVYVMPSSILCSIILSMLCLLYTLQHFLDVFVFRLNFIFSFILHPSCIIFYLYSYLHFFPSFLLIHLSIRDKNGRVYQ